MDINGLYVSTGHVGKGRGSKLFPQSLEQSACRGSSFYTPVAMEVIGTSDADHLNW